MVVNQISSALEKRRAELVEVLDNNKDSMELEKQHQMFGAINEIDLFLHTLDYYQNNSSEIDDGPIRLMKPAKEEKGIFTKFFDNVKDKIWKNK